jgi:hypothetical protein
VNNSDLIERVTEATNTHVNKMYDADRSGGLCILSTNVLIRALDYFGIHAKPVKVETAVFNPVAVEWIENGYDPDVDGGQPLADAGGWIVQIDRHSQTPRRYAGHLCATVEGRWLVDASFGQFARPEKQMPMPPFVAFDLAETDWPTVSVGSKIEGCAVIIRHNADIRDFRHSKDWSQAKGKPLAGAVIRDVRAAAA